MYKISYLYKKVCASVPIKLCLKYTLKSLQLISVHILIYQYIFSITLLFI